MKDLNFYNGEKEKIERIQYMESIFDQLQEIVRNEPHRLEEVQQKQKLEILMDYYEGGQWLRDYESDERGELPEQLKRGVLSEDGVYNLLTELNNRTLTKLPCWGDEEDHR